jgi:glutamyl-tRNA reductase
VPTVAALHGAADAVVAEVLERNAPHWESLSHADRERVEQLAHAVARRLLHAPTLGVKAAAAEGDDALERALRALFGLPAADAVEEPTPAAPRLARGA